MTFWQWLQENWVKTLSSIGALNSALITATASGMFTGLLPDNSIKWLALGGFFMNAWLIGVGFNNSSKVAVAKVIDNALNTPPPNQGGFARVGLLALLALASAGILTACQTTPVDVIKVACTPGTTYTAERCAKGVGETYEVYQKRSAEITSNPSTPAEVKQSIKAAELATSEVVVNMLEAGAVYAQVKQELAAGQTTEEKVAIADAKLAEWVAKALPLIRSFGDKLGR